MKKEKTIVFRVDGQLMSDIDGIAKAERVSTSCLIRAALKKFTVEYGSRKSNSDRNS